MKSTTQLAEETTIEVEDIIVMAFYKPRARHVIENLNKYKLNVICDSSVIALTFNLRMCLMKAML